MRHLLPVCIAISLIALGLPAQAQKRAEPLEIDRIVAVVGDEVITQYDLSSRLNTAVRQLEKQGTALPPRNVLETQMLERLITDRAQLQFAKESGLRIDDIQLDQAIARIAANNKMNMQQFRQALEKDGIPFVKFREDIREEMTIGRLREREVDSKLSVSEGEIDNYLSAQGAKGAGDETRIAHILMRAPEAASPEQLQKLRAKAEQVLIKAQAGESFAQLAAAYSDSQDALQGGDLGYRPLNNLPTLYAEAAEKLAPGAISPVLRSSAGFHIIKLLDKRGGILPPVRQTHARHILIKIDEVVSAGEAKRRLEVLRERLVNGHDFAELARNYSQDGSAARGGDLGWLNVGDTVPDFERAMDALKLNEISPIVQSPFGVHLIQVLERREKDMTDESRRQQARQALRDRKSEEAYQDWLRQLRDRTYVENRLIEK